jgi:hypothetical protein
MQSAHRELHCITSNSFKNAAHGFVSNRTSRYGLQGVLPSSLSREWYGLVLLKGANARCKLQLSRLVSVRLVKALLTRDSKPAGTTGYGRSGSRAFRCVHRLIHCKVPCLRSEINCLNLSSSFDYLGKSRSVLFSLPCTVPRPWDQVNLLAVTEHRTRTNQEQLHSRFSRFSPASRVASHPIFRLRFGRERAVIAGRPGPVMINNNNNNTRQTLSFPSPTNTTLRQPPFPSQPTFHHLIYSHFALSLAID